MSRNNLIHRLINEKRWDELTGYLNGRLDLALEPAWVERTALLGGLRDYAKDHFDHKLQVVVRRTESDILCWWKIRAAEAGRDRRPEPAGFPTINFPIELHIGFLCLEETPDMLLRLRVTKNDQDDTPKVATPAIERTNLAKITPVDATAARVVPTEE